MTDKTWWRGAVVYQIYPRSFRDANGDGVGDLKGVIEKLGHVADLGVDAIWLSPFFRSPMKDFGYDVSDYRDVDPIFGSMADFDRLLERAHACGLKVIIDQVWSHSSDQHAWFEASATQRDGPYADYYVWADAKPDGSPPNNWQSVFGGPSWTWHPRRRQYYLHNFLPSQPDLNFWNPAVRQDILDIAEYWLDRGVDGFRLDVINLAFHDRALRDNPARALSAPPAMASLFQRHLYDRSRPETLGFVEAVRALTDRYDARMMVGEIFDEDQLTQQKIYVAGDARLHTAYSFFLLDAHTLSPALFDAAAGAWDDASGWPSWSLGNHDVVRFATRFGLDGDGDRIKLALGLLMAMRGTIFLYQGEELGLPQADVPRESLRDPFAIAAYTGGAFRDGARTPMPWHGDLIQAGFSTAAETWLPVDPRHRALCVHTQRRDPHSILSFTKALIETRRSHPSLRDGAVVRHEVCGDGWRLLRGGETAIECLFNLSASQAMHFGVDAAHPRAVFSHGDVAIETGGVRLAPGAFVYLALRDGPPAD